jgi:hypothetical protein
MGEALSFHIGPTILEFNGSLRSLDLLLLIDHADFLTAAASTTMNNFAEGTHRRWGFFS